MPLLCFFIAAWWPLSYLPPLVFFCPPLPLLPLAELHISSISAHPSINLAPPLPLLSAHFFFSPTANPLLMSPLSSPPFWALPSPSLLLPFLQHLLVCVCHRWPFVATCQVLLSVSHRDPKSLTHTHTDRLVIGGCLPPTESEKSTQI